MSQHQRSQEVFALSHADLIRKEDLQEDKRIDLAGLLRLDNERLFTLTRLVIDRYVERLEGKVGHTAGGCCATFDRHKAGGDQ